jgi:hypothetical protein
MVLRFVQSTNSVLGIVKLYFCRKKGVFIDKELLLFDGVKEILEKVISFRLCTIINSKDLAAPTSSCLDGSLEQFSGASL